MAEIARRLHISRARVGQIVLAQGLSKSAARAPRPLTKRQASILAFVQEFTARNPYPPTVREITEVCRLSSTSVTDYNLLHLKDRGYLVRISGIARGTILIERGKAVGLGLLTPCEAGHRGPVLTLASRPTLEPYLRRRYRTGWGGPLEETRTRLYPNPSLNNHFPRRDATSGIGLLELVLFVVAYLRVGSLDYARNHIQMEIASIDHG